MIKTKQYVQVKILKLPRSIKTINEWKLSINNSFLRCIWVFSVITQTSIFHKNWFEKFKSSSRSDPLKVSTEEFLKLESSVEVFSWFSSLSDSTLIKVKLLSMYIFIFFLSSLRLFFFHELNLQLFLQSWCMVRSYFRRQFLA